MKQIVLILCAILLMAIPIFSQNAYFPEPTLIPALIGERIDTNKDGQIGSEECTIGVASGKATADGRPLVWKTRDTDPADQSVYFNTTGKYKFVIVRSNGNSKAVGGGVNEKGFAIVNAAALDLPGSGSYNLTVMFSVLEKCATVEEFEHFLDSITQIGVYEIQSSMGVIDSTGAAAIFETTKNKYWKFDANDTTQAPDGYIVRTNFTVNGGGNVGLPQYNRSMKLIGDFYNGDSLNYRSIIRHQMRDFSDANSNPIPVPYPDFWLPDLPFGHFSTGDCICRFINQSALVIQGVLPNEPGKLSTMWAMLGDPATSITVPYWPVCQTPSVANKPPSTPLYKVAYSIRSSIYYDKYYIYSYRLRNEAGEGLWASIFPAEDSIFKAAEIMLEKWRQDTLIVQEMSDTETSLAEYALSVLQLSYSEILYLSLVESKSIYDSTDTIFAEINLDGTIYIVPDGTSPTIDSITKYQVATVEALANTEVPLSFSELSVGKYAVLAVSSKGFVCTNPYSINLVENANPPKLELANETVSQGNSILATSNKDGNMYLVIVGTTPENIFIQTGRKKIIDSIKVTANKQVEFLTNDLNPDEYLIYARDIYGQFSDASAVVVDESTGIVQNRTKYINIFPNPANDILYVEVPVQFQNEFEVKIINVTGKMILQKTGYIEQIDISDIPPGVYLISVQSKDFVSTKKIIKR